MLVLAALFPPYLMLAQETQCAGFTADNPITPKIGVEKVGLLVVSFAYQNQEARKITEAGWGLKNDTVIEAKYKYQDYWNLLFQESGSVKHPDSGDVPAVYSANGVDFFTPGSVRAYFKENSSGLYLLEPGKTKGWRTGVINPVWADSMTLLSITLPKQDTMYTDPTQIALDALLAADSLYQLDSTKFVNIAGGDFDNIVILFAGYNRWGTGRANWSTIRGKRLGWVCTAERYNPVDSSGTWRMTFTYMSVLAHEYAHLLNLQDHYDINFHSQSKRVTNHFDLMGWNSPLSRYAPPHLNPLDKVQLGWADVVFASSGRQENLALPIMEDTYNGGKPFVLAVPLTAEWRDSTALPAGTGKFLIVENRRARDQRFDMKMNRSSHEQNYNQERGSGGFLIWRYDNPTVGTPTNNWSYTVVEADSGYHMTRHEGEDGDPGDFFSGREFSYWTQPGLYEWPSEDSNIYGYPFTDRGSGNVYLKFPPYSDSANVNTIDVVCVDKLYSRSQNALEGNNQIKHMYDPVADRDYMVMTVKNGTNDDGGLVVALQSTDKGATWPTSWLLSGMRFSGLARTVDTACFPSMDLMDGAPYIVWSEKRPDGKYDIKGQNGISQLDTATMIVSGIEVDSTGPIPLVAAYAVGQTEHLDVLFEAADSLRSFRSTDSGMNWEQNASMAALSNDSKLTMQIRDQNSTTMCGLAAFAKDSIIAVLNLEDLTTHELPVAAGSIMAESPCMSFRPDPYASSISQRGHYAWVMTSPNTHYFQQVKEIAHWTGKLDDPDACYATHIFRIDTAHQSADMYSRPVVRAGVFMGDSLSAAAIWNANSGGGPRIMYAEFKYNAKARAHRWENRCESVLGSFYAHPNPFLTEYADGFRFMVEEDLNRTSYMNRYGPVLVARMKLSDDIAGQGVFYQTAEDVEIAARDATGRTIWATLKIGQPNVVESYNVLESYLFDGIRDEGIDGSAAGPIVDSLSHTELIPVYQGQVILFDVRYRKHRTNGNLVQITARMYDDITQGVISTSGPHNVWSTTSDTTITVGLELPFGFDSAHAHSLVSISGGDFDDPERHITIQRNYYCERMPVEKRFTRIEKPVPGSARLAVYPTIAGDNIQVKFSAGESGTAVLTVFDALGRTMHREQLEYGSQSLYRNIATNRWPRGVYFCTIHYRGISETIKFVHR